MGLRKIVWDANLRHLVDLVFAFWNLYKTYPLKSLNVLFEEPNI